MQEFVAKGRLLPVQNPYFYIILEFSQTFVCKSREYALSILFYFYSHFLLSAAVSLRL